MKSFHVTTFGCQMNEHDSERMKGMLESLGYAEAPAREDADLILFNTCSIREKADNRLVGHLGEAKRLKAEDPERVIGIGGCWSQSMKEQVFEQFPFVDVAFGPGLHLAVAERLEHPRHALGVVLVHLAPERGHVEARHGAQHRRAPAASRHPAPGSTRPPTARR